MAPVFLLTGVGAMLSVLSGRLGRAVDRARLVEGRDAATDLERDRLNAELKLQERRCKLIYAAMTLCVLCALLICSVIIGLFASSFFEIRLGVPIGLLFVAAMLAFIAALVVFVREVHLAISNLKFGPR
ncbi:DUF2721 domain-containing protein [Bradyrhizobium sp. LHD-71]|uniref:DUF2721 domain-containing protein n=1 Tax=Bradyrhizobium sp. LHD-71 TaxID=3072141 RepID=UPI00280F3E27|nr:DUF2721 domain-containing protein [Bradyrhizobium sp. LHD-71]MDQ8729323.1 DUF2721 domain-containing protein [Bradyrhizobium sp. LHD-71]